MLSSSASGSSRSTGAGAQQRAALPVGPGTQANPAGQGVRHTGEVMTALPTPDCRAGQQADSVLAGLGAGTHDSPPPATVAAVGNQREFFTWLPGGAAGHAPENAAAVYLQARTYLEQKLPELKNSGRWYQGDEGPTLHHTFAENVRSAGQRFSAAIKNLFSLKNPAGNVLGNRPLSGFYATFSANSGLRTAVAVSNLVRAVPVGVELAASSAGLGFTFVDGIFSGKDLADMQGGVDGALRILVENSAAAEAYAHHGQASHAKAFLAYVDAARKIPDISRAAGDILTRARIAAARDSGLLTAASVVSNVRNYTTAAQVLTPLASFSMGVTGGIGAIASGVTDIVHGVKEYGSGQKQVDTLQKKIERVDQAVMNIGAAVSQSDQRTLMVWKNTQQELQSQARRASLFGLIRAVKGGAVTAAGAVGVGLSVSAYMGLIASSAGLALLAIPAAISALFLASSACKLYYRGRDENTSKERQRQARSLIETFSSAELIRMFEGQEQKAVVFESNGALWRQTINAGENEYLAMHLLALRLMGAKPADSVANLIDGDAQEAAKLLQILGLDSLELDAILKATCSEPPEFQLEYLKKRIAAAFGLSFRTEADGHERPAPVLALMETFIRVAKESFKDHMPVPGPDDALPATEPHAGILAVSDGSQEDRIFATIGERFFSRVERVNFLILVDRFITAARAAKKAGTHVPERLSEQMNLMQNFLRWWLNQLPPDQPLYRQIRQLDLKTVVLSTDTETTAI